MAVNKIKSYAVWFEPIPDRGIDDDLPEYVKVFGPDSYYVHAQRLTDWDEFRNRVLELEGREELVALHPVKQVAFASLATEFDEDSLGTKLISDISQIIGIEPEWSIQETTRVQWWAAEFRHEIYVEGPVDDDGYEIWRLHLRTDILRDFVNNEAQNLHLADLAKSAVIAGFVPNPQDRSRIQIASSMFFHEETYSQTLGMAIYCLATQLMTVESIHIPLSNTQSTGLKVDKTGHPDRGMRREKSSTIDDACSIVIKLGQTRVDLQAEFAEVEESFGDSAVSCSAGEDFSARFPFPGHLLEVVMITSPKHPLVGSGAMCHVTLRNVPESLPRTILDMNETELTYFTRCNFLGTWYDQGTERRFISFLPNVALRPGVAEWHLNHSIVRAGWLTNELLGYSWIDNIDSARAAFRNEVAEFVAQRMSSAPPKKPGLLKRLFGK